QPNPEFEIKRQEEQRRALESKTRSEVSMVEAESKMMVAEADIVLKMAQARKLGDDTELKKLEILQKEMEGKRRALLEMVAIEEENEARRLNAGSD
ncbi:MAG: hypothetical protein ACO21T_14155, partial [Alphaproteobacteria bacterium]